MEIIFKVLITFHIMLHCNGIGLRKQWERFARRFNPEPSHSIIIGAPSIPSHLPEAEPILPGHTLLRPARGMLKSSVKFPHRDLDNGAGVYGNVNNLGIRYGGKQERVMYSGFRRSPSIEYIEKLQNKLQKSGDNGMTRRDLAPLGFVIIETPDDVEDTSVASNEDNEHNELENIEENQREKSNEKIDKTSWFWNTKNLFNNIKISIHAPELSELMPEKLKNKPKDWWFYNQEDFQPFEEII